MPPSIFTGLLCFPSFVRLSRSAGAFPERDPGRSPASWGGFLWLAVGAVVHGAAVRSADQSVGKTRSVWGTVEGVHEERIFPGCGQPQPLAPRRKRSRAPRLLPSMRKKNQKEVLVPPAAGLSLSRSLVPRCLIKWCLFQTRRSSE